MDPNKTAAEGPAPNTPAGHGEGEMDPKLGPAGHPPTSRRGHAQERPEPSDPRGHHLGTYDDAIAAVARGIKQLTDAGIGGAEAGRLAWDIYNRTSR